MRSAARNTEIASEDEARALAGEYVRILLDGLHVDGDLNVDEATRAIR